MDGNSVVNEVFSRLFSRYSQVAYGLQIANRIKAIRSKLDEMNRDRIPFNFDARRPAEPVANIKDWRQTHSSVSGLVVGREEDQRKIVDMLLQSSYKEEVAVIPIIGMGGSGKTTLAQLVFNDDAIKSRFDCRVWVCVSENFYPKLLVKKILESLTKNEVEDFTLNTLMEKLHEEIKNKQILLVLDDVWNEDWGMWKHFWNIFASGAAGGSRMVVTTRLQIVARMTATRSIVPYQLQGLSQPASWSLFQKIAFCGGVVPGPRFLKIGEEIVRNCKGVPLVIRAMGALLYFKETESEWEAIRNRQLSSLDYSDGEDNDILARTFKLSFDNLPPYLKRCFAYCSLFPEGHEIDVKMLVQLWMAQEYITQYSSSSPLEDVGVEYFMRLSWSLFFQEVTEDAYGNMKSCKMHDLMHHLARTVAGEETLCLNASNLTDSLLNSHNVINLKRVRNLSIDFENRPDIKVWQVPSLLAKATRLQTFLLINVHSEGVKLQGACGKIFPKMTRLRVLGLGGAEMESFSFILGKLKHLRYLDLSRNNEMERLPNKITTLVNLQVLHLHLCEKLRLLPEDVGKLCNLMYLDLLGCDNLACMPAGIRNLAFLRELSYFLVAESEAAADGSSGAAAAGLGELNSLDDLSGRLSIRGLERVEDRSEAEAARLKEKSQLQCLELRWTAEEDNNNHSSRVERCDPESVLEALQPHHNLKELVLHHYGGRSIPTTSPSCWFSSLTNLVRLELNKCRKLRSLPPLDPLVSLQKLVLCDLESLEYIQREIVAASSSSSSASSSQYLPSLESLKIERCRNLIGWSPTNTQDDESPLLPRLSNLWITGIPNVVSLPKWLQHSSKLQRLEIHTCHNLKSLPSWLTKLTALESLKVKGCDLLSGRCRGNTAEDWSNISHIRNIQFDDIDVQKDGSYVEMEQQQQQQRQQHWQQQLQQQQQQLEQQPQLQQEQQQQQEASSHAQISRLFENGIVWIISNLCSRCFLPD